MEREILSTLLRPGMRALDVGTAATGRSAMLLRDIGADVVSIDFNRAAIDEFVRTNDPRLIQLAVADMCALPFEAGAFDLVLVAFHGMDYLIDQGLRHRAFREAHRVLRPGGGFVFNGFNRLGLILSPDYLGMARVRKLRARYLLRAGFLRRTLTDPAGLELYQASPRETIRAVQDAAGFRFRFVTDLQGRSRSMVRVTLFATEPYYVFKRE